jgi:hypothetical protein
MEARIHAIGWTGLNNAFGGKADYVDLLPFPELIRKDAGEKDKISPETIQTIKRLDRLGKIPHQVLVAIAQTSKEVAELC